MKLKRGTQGRGQNFSLEEKEECRQSLIQSLKGQELLKTECGKEAGVFVLLCTTLDAQLHLHLTDAPEMPVSTGAQGCLHPAGVGSAREGVFLLGGGVLPLGSGSGPKEGFRGTLSSCRVRRPHIVPVSGPAGSTARLPGIDISSRKSCGSCFCLFLKCVKMK